MELLCNRGIASLIVRQFAIQVLVGGAQLGHLGIQLADHLLLVFVVRAELVIGALVLLLGLPLLDHVGHVLLLIFLHHGNRVGELPREHCRPHSLLRRLLVNLFPVVQIHDVLL